jgi:hypothetical protein
MAQPYAVVCEAITHPDAAQLQLLELLRGISDEANKAAVAEAEAKSPRTSTSSDSSNSKPPPKSRSMDAIGAQTSSRQAASAPTLAS